jgi:AcrR family transcriptional regulator
MKNSERRARTVNQLLDGALDVLQDGGLAKFRSAEVTKRSGVAEGSFFRYFPTKGDLTAAALDRAFDAQWNRLELLFPQNAAAPTRAMLVEGLCGLYADRRVRWTYELMAAVTHGVIDDERLIESIHVHNDRVIQRVTSLLGPWRPLINDDETMLFAEMLVMTIQGFAINDLSFDVSFRRGTLHGYLVKLGNLACAPEPEHEFDSVLSLVFDSNTPLRTSSDSSAEFDTDLPQDTETRTAILEGTVSLLDEVGFNRLRMADAANRSGVTEGALYYYFPSRTVLLRAALHHTLKEHVDRSVAAFEPLLGSPMLWSACFGVLYDVLTHPRLRWTYQLYGAAAHDPELSNALKDVVAEIEIRTAVQALRALAECGPMVLDDSIAVASMASWWSQGLVITKYGLGPADRDRMISFLCLVTERAYGPQFP